MEKDSWVEKMRMYTVFGFFGLILAGELFVVGLETYNLLKSVTKEKQSSKLEQEIQNINNSQNTFNYTDYFKATHK